MNCELPPGERLFSGGMLGVKVCIDKGEGLGGSFLWSLCSGIAQAIETGLSYSLYKELMQYPEGN